jgi:hypothetical protein
MDKSWEVRRWNDFPSNDCHSHNYDNCSDNNMISSKDTNMCWVGVEGVLEEI